jgi:DNA-binding response OmpR family regulator
MTRELSVSAAGGIAIYERDELMHALLREWLSDTGYCVRNLAVTSDSAARVDLVIVSFSMLKEKDEALVDTVQRIYPATPIIALSSQARSGLCSAGAAAQARGVELVMAKPLRRGELLAAVEAVIGPPLARVTPARASDRGDRSE